MINGMLYVQSLSPPGVVNVMTSCVLSLSARAWSLGNHSPSGQRHGGYGQQWSVKHLAIFLFSRTGFFFFVAAV